MAEEVRHMPNVGKEGCLCECCLADCIRHDTRTRPAQQPIRKPRHPCEENGCTDWQDCDEICILHPDFQKKSKCCETCPNIPCKILERVPCTQQPDALDVREAIKITQSTLIDFCEYFCDFDCEEKPCNTTVSRIRERLVGLEKQINEHPEYAEKWNTKRAEDKAAIRSKQGGGEQ